MKVMVIVKASKGSEAGEMPSEKLLRDMGQYNEDLVNAGVMEAGEGLHPSSAGFRVKFSGDKRTVVSGPFGQTNELVAGFWMWNVKSMEEAIEWVKRCPNPMMEDSEIEIRRVFTMEDFAAVDPTGDIREAEQKLAERLKFNNSLSPRFEMSKETTVAGLNKTYTYEDMAKIPEQWQKFGAYLGKVPGQVGHDAFGVSWNQKEGSGMDYMAGVAVSRTDALPKDFKYMKIPAHHYAVFKHEGSTSEIQELFRQIWEIWFPHSGKKPAHDVPMFEKYTERFDPKTGKGGIELWVPVTD